MNKIDEAVSTVLQNMTTEELEKIVWSAEDEGLRGVIESGGEFRTLASTERVSVEMSLGAILSISEDVGMTVVEVGSEILSERRVEENNE